MVTPTMFPWDKKASSRKKSRLHFCINSLVPYKLSHDRWLWFFGGGRLRVPTRRCDLVVPADGGWGRSNEFTWSFEPYVEFVPFSTSVLGSKGWAVGRGVGPLPYRPPDRWLPIVGRPPLGTRTLDRLPSRGVCRGFGRFALCDEYRAHF